MKRINGQKMAVLLFFNTVIACLCYKEVNTRITFWSLKQQDFVTVVPVKN